MRRTSCLDRAERSEPGEDARSVIKSCERPAFLCRHDPTSFTIQESIFILSLIIVGGMGNPWGSLVAAAFMILVPEVLRFVGLPGAIAANVRQMLFGVALIVVIRLQLREHDRKKSNVSH